MTKNVPDNFLMGLIFQTSWSVAPAKIKIIWGLDFLNLGYKSIGINKWVPLSNFASFQNYFLTGFLFEN